MLTYGVVKKDTLAEGIAARLLDLIRERKLRPGDKLPPERELALTMRVSRPSLREALRALAMMRVIEIRQGAGTFITSLEPDLLVEHLDFVFALDDSTFLQLFDARKVLEVGIVALAAERITDAELQTLDECLADSLNSLHDHAAFLQADLALHQHIAQAARNPILLRFMLSISRLGLASRKRTVTLPGVKQQTVKDHRAIIQALRSRNPAAARAAMLQHLAHVERELQQPENTTRRNGSRKLRAPNKKPETANRANLREF